MTDQIVWLNAPGDVTQFHVEQHDCKPPGDGEIRIRHEAIGTNFLDVYHRKGLYPMPAYPAVIGAEAAGIVEDVGAGVSMFGRGDRVAYAGPFRGYGDIVILDHGHGWTTILAGLELVTAASGDLVPAGAPLGHMAKVDPRLTIELRHDGRPMDVAAMALQ